MFMGVLTRRSFVVATLAGLLIVPAHAAAAKPTAGARFTIQDHRVRDAGWRLEIMVSRRDPEVMRSVVLYDEHCGETITASRVRLTPDGRLEVGDEFTATDGRGAEQPGAWELHARFPMSHRIEGWLRLIEGGCDVRHDFAAEHERQGHEHAHGLSDPFDYPAIAGATPAARAEARRMLGRVRAVAARRFATIGRARAEGFSRYMVRVKTPEPGVFHLWSRRYNRDRAVLDPARPESLVYWKPPGGGARRLLLGFMFRARPGPSPPFAGTISSWHRHKRGGDSMTHVWLADGLRGAYANCLPVPELERSLHAFDFVDVHYDGPESQPCR